MLWITSGNLKEGKARAWQEWLQKNDDLFQKTAPPGWTYRGTYFTVLGFGRYSTTVMWECTTYGDFDALREHKEGRDVATTGSGIPSVLYGGQRGISSPA